MNLTANGNGNGHSKTKTVGVVTEESLAVGHILNKLLADEFVLYTKTRNYQWNVVGAFFHTLRAMFHAQHLEITDIVDRIASRARAVGSITYGTLSEFAMHTQLQEQSAYVPSGHMMINNLLVDHETIIAQLTEDARACADNYDDPVTANILIDLLAKHQEIAWALRSTMDN